MRLIMEANEYANAYSEVLEILKYISKEDYDKIPKNKINLFNKNANKNHKFQYDPLHTLDEQNVSKRTTAIIAILFRDYWATDEQRNKIKAFQNNKRYQVEEENRQKYEVFKNNTNIADTRIFEQAENVQLVEYKENFFRRFFGFFRKMFGK